ncbi:Metalloendopeptidase [Leptospira biflexa serovar Patoc strain 'Patoc 1 (Ames)']|uniref:Putative peptidase, M23B family putative signal peptide n=1 Tax=Leptospira biflexa serovar Patoc (strain Patoc 1 / ATCC 23582 / Paris) TaxID=456481 RepID=B0SKS7_LEPBP|nr:M23 family metallopeptidase [Leptospira biflexa]ABZ93211.1 Metalloendopeptidase [Leptospira biflexa serovar Patoc strain 'Patoc 1 (Ames)']ABZ96834.1 Putative peptidase, M23B family; putative signal peptide [Leptospira biflexa serovar Patoc strain 'Patoc 1 (Paris)']
MKKLILVLILYSIGFPISASPELVGKEECIVENTCTILVPIENGYELYLKNKSPNLEIIKSVVFNLSVKNLISNQEFPKYFVLKGGEPVFVTRLTIDDPSKSNFFSYSITVNIGDWDAIHDDSITYSLPFPDGIRSRVGQGYNGGFTHSGNLKYSIDFSLPIGTPIHAARKGTVVSLVKKYTEGGIRKDLLSKANYVMIQHEDGTIANYAHLKKEGVVVSVGETVTEGQLIGYSGNTGYSQGPHLHFEVHKPTKDSQIITLPTYFRTQYSDRETLSQSYLYWQPRQGIDPPLTNLLEEDILLCKSNGREVLQQCKDTQFRLGDRYAIQLEYAKPTKNQIELFLTIDGNTVEPFYLKWFSERENAIEIRFFEIPKFSNFIGKWKMVVKVNGEEKKVFFFQVSA